MLASAIQLNTKIHRIRSRMTVETRRLCRNDDVPRRTLCGIRRSGIREGNGTQHTRSDTTTHAGSHVTMRTKFTITAVPANKLHVHCLINLIT